MQEKEKKNEINLFPRQRGKGEQDSYSPAKLVLLSSAANKFRQRLQAPDPTEICIQKKVG